MLQIQHARLSEAEEKAVADAADDVYDLLIEKACDVGVGMAYHRLRYAGVDASNPSEEAASYISSIQMMMAKRMMARMLHRATEI